MKCLIKKIAAAIFLLCLCIIPLTNSQASAPIYLNGDPNFVRIDSHYDAAYYLDRSSIYVRKYAPPEYEIVANICYVRNALSGNTDIASVTTTEFKYDISNNRNWKMYYSYPDRSYWQYMEPKYTYSKNGIVLPAGEMCFYLEYNIPFYGKQHPYLFPDSFYNRV
ncbi:hypothetical protein [Megasphaera elsdenii]|uniref:hypothetical protein n=1 Tax=Megasphaera elsdenii TaxID=907 RepID=UPI00242A6A3D|nr:hypothetical protein [Megasphaera elsdenii]